VDYKRKADIPWWDVSELAEAGGVTGRRIRQLCDEGRLDCVKMGGRWLIFDESARKWLVSDRSPGRPPAGTRPTGEQLELDLDNE